MTLNPDDFVVMNSPRYKNVVEAYMQGDKIAVMLVENSLNIVADLGYLRSNYDGEDYFQIRAELDEYVDAMEEFYKHFNIKPMLQEHDEEHMTDLSEQTFESKECACGNCTCGGGGGEGIIIQFPGGGEIKP